MSRRVLVGHGQSHGHGHHGHGHGNAGWLPRCL